MSTATQSTAPAAAAVHPPPPVRRYGELVVVAGVLALAAFITVGTIGMEVPEGTGSPGPRFFPTIIAGFLYLTALALAVDVVRHPQEARRSPAEVSGDMLHDLGRLDETGEIRVVDGATPDPTAAPESIDWPPVLVILAGLVGFVLLLPPVGWLLCATALFWIVCRALGSTRPVFDIAVAAIVASTIQLAFSAGLGLTLPGGILEGALPWIS